MSPSSIIIIFILYPPPHSASLAAGKTRCLGKGRGRPACLRVFSLSLPLPSCSHPPPHPSGREDLGSWARAERRRPFLGTTEKGGPDLRPTPHRLSPSRPLRLYFPGQEQLVRLIYQGQLLRDDGQTLAALHLTHNSVLHCHVSQRRASPGPSSGAGSRSRPEAARPALNVGGLMVPLMVLMLGALWYFQVQHRHAFTATATTCLAGLTLLFSFVAFAAYRR
ncbi:transmembrane and ubiquitin-like domain-containing protein 1 [Crotalus adamanteus]|uniref:Transmembrane and ubiquitin-like domain-containing protein 1 n=1 Tax=Crotalus adamanteus TaxID=8729 RepID=A0AAW1B1J9_CROAD